MLELNKLVNRNYRGKECISFDYYLEDESRPEGDPTRVQFEANFRRSIDNPFEWRMRVVIPEARWNRDHQVYEYEYILPKLGLPLTFTAAMGLKLLQFGLQCEVQTKSDWNFIIGEETKDM